MTTYSAKVKPHWRASEIRDIVVAFSVTVVLLALVFSNVLDDGWDGLLTAIGVIFFLAGCLGLFFNFTRKRNSTVMAEMNTERWQVKWWGVKPIKSVWGGRLSAMHNHSSLEPAEDDEYHALTIRSTKVGKHDVFEFKVNGRTLTLPERLANTDGVRDFLLAFIAAHDDQVPAVDKETMEKLVAVLNRNRELAPPSAEELAAQEAARAAEEAKVEAVIDPASNLELASDAKPEIESTEIGESPDVETTSTEAAATPTDDPFAEYIASLNAKKAAEAAPKA